MEKLSSDNSLPTNPGLTEVPIAGTNLERDALRLLEEVARNTGRTKEEVIEHNKLNGPIETNN